MIKREHQQRLNAFVMETCNRLDCHCLIANGPGDHIHMLLVLSCRKSLSDVVKEVKRTSTNWLKETDAHYYRAFYWQAGYGAFSISAKLKEAVYQYIANQQEHHQKQSSRDEFFLLLKNARVDTANPSFYFKE